MTISHQTSSYRQPDQRGVVLLFVVIVLTTIFSISIGVFSIILSQIRTSQTFESSYIALYAADQAAEKTFYRDRQENDFSALPIGAPTRDPLSDTATASGGCFTVTITKFASSPNTAIITQGLSTSCGSITDRTAARAFRVIY